MSVRLLNFILLLSLCACSGNPLIPDADRSKTPLEIANKDSQLTSITRQWGGVIISSKNLSDVTEIEILAYPLDTNGRPNLGVKSIGRFIARKEGYLETTDFARSHLVTATGLVSEIRSGEVGEAEYLFPVMNCDDLALWPVEDESRNKPRIHFGFGASSGGRSYGGIGIGIGF